MNNRVKGFALPQKLILTSGENANALSNSSVENLVSSGPLYTNESHFLWSTSVTYSRLLHINAK